MAGIGPGDLDALAHELLDACIEALDTIPDYDATLEGAPDRSFVTAGDPAADCCPQLTVHVRDIFEAPTEPGGLGSGRRASYGRINHIGLTMTLFRCVPVGSGDIDYQPPSADELEAAAIQINADGWALWNHLYNMIRDEQLFALCRGVFWEGMRALPPQGACAGWVMTFRIALDGYEAAASS